MRLWGKGVSRFGPPDRDGARWDAEETSVDELVEQERAETSMSHGAAGGDSNLFLTAGQ